MCRFKSVLEDSAFILNKEQRNTIKAFVDRKYVFAVLPTGSGKSLMYQLAPSLWSYYVALIGSRYIQLSEEAFFFPGSVETLSQPNGAESDSYSN